MTNRAIIYFLVLGLGLVFSALVPPLQSPDEFDHIKRAYLFSKGQILLDHPAGMMSGGRIDTGLLAYFTAYKKLPRDPEARISQEEIQSVSNIKWSGVRAYSTAPGTGYYFPLAYTPQAIGLFIGEQAGLSIDLSYRLARFFTLLFSVSAIAVAFAVFPTNAFVVALLIIPMSIFQFVSASLDAFTNSATVLCISLFMRGIMTNINFSSSMFYALSISIFVLTTTRIHLLPLLALPLILYAKRRTLNCIWHFLILLALSLTWLTASISATHISRGQADLTTSKVIAFYLQNPSALIKALADTLGNEGLVDYYIGTFIGVLGWLDTRFSSNFYALCFYLLITIGVLTISFRSIKEELLSRATLIGIAAIAFVLIFVALLITYNPLTPRVIEGVQGRYFLTPLIIIGYALSGTTGLWSSYPTRVATILLVVLFASTLASMPQVLIERYFMRAEKADARGYQMRPSAPLGIDAGVPLLMGADHLQEPAGLKRIGVLFGTYGNANSGEAGIKLSGAYGEEFWTRFSLSELANNEYRFFEIDSRRYVMGELFYISGGGISTWESHSNWGGRNTCMILEYSNGRKLYTKGCPTE